MKCTGVHTSRKCVPEWYRQRFGIFPRRCIRNLSIYHHGPKIAGDDIRQKLEFHHVHLELGALGYIESFLFYWSWGFFPKKKTTKADFRFWKHKGPPFGFEKIFFFKSPQIIFLSKRAYCILSHDSKRVKHLGIKNIFQNIFKNIFGKIFLKIFLKKIFTKNISNTQVLYHFGIVRTNAIQWLW